jgi:hypothetical protein
MRPMGVIRSSLLKHAAGGGEWTMKRFAESSGRSADICRPHVAQLEKFGWLRKVREERNPGGGKKIYVYAWTGKALPDAERLAAADGDCRSLVFRCMSAMVGCGRQSQGSGNGLG